VTTTDNKIIEEYKGFLLVYKSDSVRYEKTDARRSKDYHITVSWAVTILDTQRNTSSESSYDDNRACRVPWEHRAQGGIEEVRKHNALYALPGYPYVTTMTDWEVVPAEVREKFDPSLLQGREHNSVRCIRVRCMWRRDYDRPKDMPEAPGDHPKALQQAVEAICEEHDYSCRDDLQSKMLDAIKQMLDKHLDKLAAEERARDAAWLAGWIGKEADQKARAIVRFDQRLAALVAELEAEQQIQGEKVIEDVKADPTEKDSEGNVKTYDPRVIKAAIQHVKYPRPFPGGFGLDNNTKVPVEDVL
jgi:hypothetical protein